MSAPLTDDLICSVATFLALTLAPECGQQNSVRMVKVGAPSWIDALHRANAGERTFLVIGDLDWPNVGITAGTEDEVADLIEGRRCLLLSLNTALARAREKYRRSLQ